jgi:hypothetical protein
VELLNWAIMTLLTPKVQGVNSPSQALDDVSIAGRGGWEFEERSSGHDCKENLDDLHLFWSIRAFKCVRE